jgi:hypothetical protein
MLTRSLCSATYLQSPSPGLASVLTGREHGGSAPARIGLQSMQQEYVVLQEAGHQVTALLKSMKAAHTELQEQVQQQEEQQCQEMTAEQVAALVDDLDLDSSLTFGPDNQQSEARAPPASNNTSKPTTPGLPDSTRYEAQVTGAISSAECLMLLTPLLQGLELQLEMLVRGSHQQP